MSYIIYKWAMASIAQTVKQPEVKHHMSYWNPRNQPNPIKNSKPVKSPSLLVKLLLNPMKFPMNQLYIIPIWLVVYLPRWKIWVRQLGWWHSQYMESHKIHIPNHQAVPYVHIPSCCRSSRFCLLRRSKAHSTNSPQVTGQPGPGTKVPPTWN